MKPVYIQPGMIWWIDGDQGRFWTVAVAMQEEQLHRLKFFM